MLAGFWIKVIPGSFAVGQADCADCETHVKKTGVLYFNPASGSYDADRFEQVAARARDAGLELRQIDPDLDIRADIGDRLKRGERLFTVAGGDGSIHHAVQALAGSDGILAIIPIGTFNHLARDLGIPLDPLEAIEIAITGFTTTIDLGLVNDKYFVNNMLLGIYPEIVRHRESLRRRYTKYRAYMKALRFALRRFPHVAVELETEHSMEVIKTHMLAIAVNEYDMASGGLLVPKLSFNSGVLTAYWIPYRAKWSYFFTLVRYLRGKIRAGDDMRRMSSRVVKVRSKRRTLKAGIDGELVELKVPFEVRIVPAALRIRSPQPERNRT